MSNLLAIATLSNEIEELKKQIRIQVRLIESLEESMQIAFTERKALANCVDTLQDLILTIRKIKEKEKDEKDENE